jgi:hypothetical protein
MSQLDCCMMESAGRFQIVNVPAIAPHDRTLACLHDGQKRDLTWVPVEQNAAFAAMFCAQNTRFYEKSKHLGHVSRGLT